MATTKPDPAAEARETSDLFSLAGLNAALDEFSRRCSAGIFDPQPLFEIVKQADGRRPVLEAIAAALFQRDARIAKLEDALNEVATIRQFGNCWCSTINRTYCVGQPKCKRARAALRRAKEG